MFLFLGFIGKIQLQVPISRLKSEHWTITLDKLVLVAGPLTDAEVGDCTAQHCWHVVHAINCSFTQQPSGQSCSQDRSSKTKTSSLKTKAKTKTGTFKTKTSSADTKTSTFKTKTKTTKKQSRKQAHALTELKTIPSKKLKFSGTNK